MYPFRTMDARKNRGRERLERISVDKSDQVGKRGCRRPCKGREEGDVMRSRAA